MLSLTLSTQVDNNFRVDTGRVGFGRVFGPNRPERFGLQTEPTMEPKLIIKPNRPWSVGLARCWRREAASASACLRVAELKGNGGDEVDWLVATREAGRGGEGVLG